MKLSKGKEEVCLNHGEEDNWELIIVKFQLPTIACVLKTFIIHLNDGDKGYMVEVLSCPIPYPHINVISCSEHTH